MAHIDKDHDISHSSERSPDSGSRKSASRKARGHCAKFWWIYLLLLIILILVIVLPIIFVGFPRRAQKDVNASALEISSLSFTDPTPESIHLTQESTLKSNSSHHPTLDAFNATLFLENTLPNIQPIVYLEVPGVRSTGSVPVNIDQTLAIANVGQLTNFAKVVLGSREFRLAIRGRTKLHQGSLHTDVDYNEVVTLKGLNGLQGFNVTSFQVKIVPEPDGANLIGKVFIPNPSVLTIAMGNVTLNLYVTGTFLGTSQIQGLTLKPGDNTFDIRSFTNQATVLSKLSQFSNGILPVDITGNSSVYNGQHLTYYEEALKSSTQRVSLNIGGALRAAGGS
ncbi:MAG: hypothetical protein M1814_002035 [Vezdaea aestivalis]|nr:MAG: hypothetical protein M1814_002035 [Vezdaea aestivalis]